MLGGYATAYPSDLLLDFFTYGGAWSTNQLGNTGAGLGAVYSIADTGFSVSGNYVAINGDDSLLFSIAKNAFSLVEEFVTFRGIVLIVGRLFDLAVLELGRKPVAVFVKACHRVSVAQL